MTCEWIARGMRTALAIVLLGCGAVAGAACLETDLTGRPCPCLAGFDCVDDVCVPAGGLGEGGVAEGEGDGDGEGEGEASEGEGGGEGEGEGDGGEGEGDVGEGEGEGEGDGACPASFTNAGDDIACVDADPPAFAVLVATCDDGNTYPPAIFNEVGAGAGSCDGPPNVATVTGSAMSGGISFDADTGNMTINLAGDVELQIDVAEQCFVGQCLGSSGSGECGDAPDGSAFSCQCTGVVLDQDDFEEAQVFAGNGGPDDIVGDFIWIGCLREDGSYLLRENQPSPDFGFGPIFVFQ